MTFFRVDPKDVITTVSEDTPQSGHLIGVFLDGPVPCTAFWALFSITNSAPQKPHLILSNVPPESWPRTVSTKNPGSWDEAVWDFVCAVLSDSSWIESQLEVEQNKSIAAVKLLEAEQRKIAQIRAKIARVQEGYEAGIYNTEDAKTHITGYQKAISSSEQEIERLQQPGGDGLTSIDIENLRLELKAFAEKKFEEATFEEKQDIISKLNIKAYPSEDLKTMRVKCGVNFVPEDSDNIQCGKIIFAPLKGIRTCG
jgi:hypothetical protein